MSPILKIYLEKAAGAKAPYGYTGHSVQTHLPVNEKRELDKEEERNIRKGSDQWMPKIFKSYKTPAHELLASPMKQALLAGIPFGALGGAVGYGMTAGKGHDQYAGLGTGIGAVGMGGLAGLISYFSRKAQNENILSLMSRLPKGSTYRDLLSDPVLQADMNRQLMATQGMGNNAGWAAAAMSLANR